MANNKTVWQNLTDMLNVYPTDSLNKPNQKIVIRGNSPDDIRRKQLELEQQKEINRKFNTLTDHGFQKAMQYEAARLPAYLDYEGMEWMPLIASALDLFMEEATTIGDNGKMLKIYSDKERIKEHLEDFFYNIVNVNVNLPFWTRNLPIREDSVIPLLDGTELTIKEIADQLKENPKKEIWTYSIKQDTNDVVGGKIIWCDKTRSNSELVRVHLDDGTYLDTTPDHEFMTRLGKFIQAKDLKTNQSLMPFYTKDKIHGYEKAYNPRSNHYEYIDSTINSKIYEDESYKKASSISKNKILNHKVLKIEFLSETADVYCMEVVGKNGEHDRHNFAICSKDSNGNYTRNGVFVSNCKYGDNFVYMMGTKKKGVTHVKQMVNYEMERLEKVADGKTDVKFKQRETGQEFNLFEVAHFRLLGDDKYLPYGSSILNKVRRVFRQLVMAEDSMLTYRITRAGEKRVFKIDVGNIDEDDIEEYVQKTMARFKKQQQVYPDTGQIDYRFNILGVDEDYVMPIRNQQNGSVIDTLPGAQNLDQIADITYLRDNLFTGLGVPKPFLGFQDSGGDGKNMAQMDVRFSKKINRIQQALIQELNKMAMVHLYLLGFDKDFSNFSLSLTNPSTQQEILMAEMMQQKAQVYSELTRNEGGIAAMSHTNAKRLMFGWTDVEIANDLKIQKMERAIAQELQDSPLTIPKTGIFNDIDDRYGDPNANQQAGGELEAGEGEPEENLPPAGEAGAEAPQSPSELPPVIGQGQGFKDDSKKPQLSEEDYDNKVSSMLNVGKKETDKFLPKKVINETKNKVTSLNEKAITMSKEIDSLLGKNDSINEEEIDIEIFRGDNLQEIVNEAINKNNNED